MKQLQPFPKDARAKNRLLEKQLDSTSGDPKVIAKRNPELSKAAKSNPTSHQVEDPTKSPQHPKHIDLKRKPRGFLQRDLPRRVSRRTPSLRHLPFEGLTRSRPSRKDLPREESPEGHSPPWTFFPKDQDPRQCVHCRPPDGSDLPKKESPSRHSPHWTSSPPHDDSDLPKEESPRGHSPTRHPRRHRKNATRGQNASHLIS
jgi:hypothetical protein